MRFDHIVVHVDNNLQDLQALKATLNANGYPFDPAQGRRNRECITSAINIGNEYIEIVRIYKPNARSWMPWWTKAYDEGQRGAFCIFIELEDVERAAVALKKAGIAAVGPSVIHYPFLFGLIRVESPYFIYFIPAFPGSNLHLGLMQYKKKGGRENFQAGMAPNAIQNGINGIRRVEVALPSLKESVDMLKKIFPNLEEVKDAWAIQLEKTRLFFAQSPDEGTHVRLSTVTSQRTYASKKVQIDNVELVTIGG